MSAIKITSALLLSLGMSSMVSAQGLSEPVSLTYVGSWSALPLYKQVEKPFWEKILVEESGGKLTTRVTNLDQMGFKGDEVFRLLSDGMFDVGTTVVDYIGGDVPEAEIFDMPSLANDLEGARAVVESFRPMLRDILKDRYDVELIGITSYTQAILLCKSEIKNLSSVKGKKIRTSGRTATDFVKALGGIPVNISFGEVAGALQHGTVDCGVTSALDAYAAGWGESTEYVYNFPFGGWDYLAIAMNRKKWNDLGQAGQEWLVDKVRNIEEAQTWDLQLRSDKEGIHCLTGNGECTLGKPNSLTLVSPTAQDLEEAAELLRTTLLPAWAKRVDKKWVDYWNSSTGKELDQIIGG